MAALRYRLLPIVAVTLREIEREIRSLAARIDAPEGAFPTFGASEQDGTPHIETDARGLHWVVCERGLELERHTFETLSALMEHVFDSITFGMGVAYELRHRRPLADGRRLIFARQLFLMERLSTEWSERCAARIRSTLHAHPLDDRSTLRMRIARNLREGGMDADAAWARACDLLPLPG